MNTTAQILLEAITAVEKRDEQSWLDSMSRLVAHMRGGGAPADVRVDMGSHAYGRRNWLGARGLPGNPAIMTAAVNYDDPDTAAWELHVYDARGTSVECYMVMEAGS